MILLNSKECNSFNEILEKYNNMINLPYLECPNCKGNNLIRHAKYKRNVYYIYGKEIKHEIITILRVKCKNCGTTHALLPICIVPYKLSNLDIILKAISCEKIAISISLDTVNNWNKDFNKFLPYLKTMFENITKTEILNKIIKDIYNTYEEFFIKYQKILLMIRNGIKNICHF